MTSQIKSLLVASAGLCLFAVPAHAGEALVSGGQLSVQSNMSGLSNMTLTVSGPDGYTAQQSTAFGTPSVSLSGMNGMPDGQYSWQLTGATNERIRNPKAGFNNGRAELDPEFITKSHSETGTFRVVNGVVQMPGTLTEDDSDGGAR